MEVLLPQRTLNYQVWENLSKKQSDIDTILNAAVCASSSHNTQPWAFKISKDHIWIVPDFLRRLKVSDPHDRELFLSLGACLANLEVAAGHLSYAAKIESAGIAGVEVKLSQGKNPTEDLYPSIYRRVNYDGPHLPRRISSALIKRLQGELHGQSGIKLTLVQDKKTKEAIAELVFRGDQIIFSDAQFTEELVTALRDAATLRKDGLPVTVLGLPPAARRMAPQILLNSSPEQIIGVAKADQEKVAASAMLGILSAEDDTPKTWIEVGRVYQRLALIAAQSGVYFAARGVLIETGELYKELAQVVGIKDRPLMMFRAGYPPATEVLYHTPRYPAQERLAPGVALDRPTIFKLDRKNTLTSLRQRLGDISIESIAYAEHYLPDLFNLQNPQLDPRTKDYAAQLQTFIDSRSKEADGVWVYYPNSRKLVHLPEEDEFYAIITANNDRLISKVAQEKLRQFRFGVAGLSGSGTEAALAIVMSGAKHLRLADHDYLSGRNKNRVTGQIGENKTWNLMWRLWEHNPFLQLEVYPMGITKNNISEFVKGLDVVLEQTDSGSKFLVREHAKCLVIQVTDLPNPAVELERDHKPIFGGRAQKQKIDANSMGKIGSIAESTFYIAQLIGPDNLTAANWQNFIDILEGKANAYSQDFISVQAGGGAVGSLIVAFAEGKIEDLPDSWLVQTLPERSGEQKNAVKLRKEFFALYASKFPQQGR